MYFTRNNQNTFVYQPRLNNLELKKEKVTDYVPISKSNGMYHSKLKPL